MDETLVSWAVLLLVVLIGLFGMCCKCRQFMLQWYTWLMICFGALLGRTEIDIFRFDFSSFGIPLDPELASEHLHSVNADIKGHLTEAQMHDLYLGSHLSKIATCAPFLAAVAFIVVCFNIWLLHKRSREHYADGGDSLYHAPLHAVLVLIAMPGAMAVLCLRAWLRIMTLMTGSAFQTLGSPCAAHQHSDLGVLRTCGYGMSEVIALEQETSKADLAVAMACQFIAVFTFALMSVYYFRKGAGAHVDAYISALKTVGLLGVWIYVLLGFIQSILSIVVVFCVQLSDQTTLLHVDKHVLQDLAVKLRTTFDPLMGLCTILCVINMAGITRIPDMKHDDRLGKAAGLKFLATRLLLLAGTLQPKILEFILVPKPGDDGRSAFQINVENVLGPHPGLDHSLSHAAKSPIQVQLWNTSLLCVWCFVVSFINLAAWRRVPVRRHESVVPPLEAPLLGGNAEPSVVPPLEAPLLEGNAQPTA